MYSNTNSNHTSPGILAQASTAQGWIVVLVLMLLVGTVRGCFDTPDRKNLAKATVTTVVERNEVYNAPKMGR